MTFRTWPDVLMGEDSISWHLAGRVVQAPAPLSGRPPLSINTSGGGWWECVVNTARLGWDVDRIRKWLRQIAAADGGSDPVTVPYGTPLTGPFPLNAQGLPTFSMSMSGAKITVAAALRATAVTIKIRQDALDLSGGIPFSVDHGATLGTRLYMISNATFASTSGGFDFWDCTIRPPLRAATGTNEPAEFNAPTCLMRLADPDQGRLTVESRQIAYPSVKFVEA